MDSCNLESNEQQLAVTLVACCHLCVWHTLCEVATFHTMCTLTKTLLFYFSAMGKGHSKSHGSKPLPRKLQKQTVVLLNLMRTLYCFFWTCIMCLSVLSKPWREVNWGWVFLHFQWDIVKQKTFTMEFYFTNLNFSLSCDVMCPSLSRDNRSALQNVKNYKPHVEGQQIRILLHGPVGAGKSSFINSVQSVLRGSMYTQALEDNIGHDSFTKKVRRTCVLI